VRADERFNLPGDRLDPATGLLVEGIENQIHRVFGNLKSRGKGLVADRSPIPVKSPRVSDRLVAISPA